MTVTRTRDRSGYDVYLEYDGVKVGFRLADIPDLGLSWSRGLQPMLAEEQRTSGTFDYQLVPAEVDVPL